MVIFVFELRGMDEKQLAALNMAKFIRGQSLELLERLDALGLDQCAEQCERLHEQTEGLYRALQAALEENQ